MFRKIIDVLSRLNLIPIFLGLLFKTMHWPGSSVLLLFSSTTLLILHILKNLFSLEKSKSNYLKITAVILFTIFVFIDIFGSFSSVFFDLLYKIAIGAYFFTKYIIEKQSFKQNIIARILFFLSAFVLIVGYMFKMMYWPGGSALLIFGTLFAILWVISSLFNKKVKHNINDEIDTIGQS